MIGTTAQLLTKPLTKGEMSRVRTLHGSSSLYRIYAASCGLAAARPLIISDLARSGFHQLLQRHESSAKFPRVSSPVWSLLPWDRHGLPRPATEL
jgi:hypothetical protein